jgi:hypothetical protein
MQFIAQHFQELHLEKIDRLELIDRLMWQEYEKETQPYRRVKILETIANAQATVSSYYESTTIALEVSTKFNGNNGEDKANYHGHLTFEEWMSKNNQPRVADDSQYSDEENGQYYWDLHRRYQEYVKDWENSMFDPDTKNAWLDRDEVPLKSILRISGAKPLPKAIAQKTPISHEEDV